MASISKHAHHITPIKVYLTIGAILLILTAVTVEVSFHDFGAFNMVVALTIASLKASWWRSSLCTSGMTINSSSSRLLSAYSF